MRRADRTLSRDHVNLRREGTARVCVKYFTKLERKVHRFAGEWESAEGEQPHTAGIWHDSPPAAGT